MIKEKEYFDAICAYAHTYANNKGLNVDITEITTIIAEKINYSNQYSYEKSDIEDVVDMAYEDILDSMDLENDIDFMEEELEEEYEYEREEEYELEFI